MLSPSRLPAPLALAFAATAVICAPACGQVKENPVPVQTVPGPAQLGIIAPIAPAQPTAHQVAASEPFSAPRNLTAAETKPVPLENFLEELHGMNLLFPVAGRGTRGLTDTFFEARGTSRVHHALDIPAPRGTPVLSTDNGYVLKLFTSKAGGLTVYTTDPTERFIYYYAHLDHYRTALREGMPLTRGDTIGYVGTTGNAPPNTPHLHFAILRSENIRRWSAGTPVNPFKVFIP